MPLSKKRDAARKRLERVNIQPKAVAVQPRTFYSGEIIMCGGAEFKVPKGKAWIVDIDINGIIQPNSIEEKSTLEPWEVTDWANYKGEVVPIPNCPDGRYRGE